MLRARLVRDYLELEFQNSALPFPFSLEHVVDDFVLFCMLIGNDFLPCEPLTPFPLTMQSRLPSDSITSCFWPKHCCTGWATLPSYS